MNESMIVDFINKKINENSKLTGCKFEKHNVVDDRDNSSDEIVTEDDSYTVDPDVTETAYVLKYNGVYRSGNPSVIFYDDGCVQLNIETDYIVGHYSVFEGFVTGKDFLSTVIKSTNFIEEIEFVKQLMDSEMAEFKLLKSGVI